MRGIGDDLERGEAADLAVVIATPPFGCATVDVYRGVGRRSAVREGETVEIDGLPPLRNDLEPAAHHVEPRLAAFKAAVERAAGRARAARGQRLVVRGRVPVRRRRPSGARARIAEVVEGQIVVGRTVDAGVRSGRSGRGTGRSRRELALLALLTALPTGLLQKLLVLLLAHALAALFDQ